MSISEDMFIYQIKRKNEKALFYLYKKHHLQVLKFIEKKIRNKQEAEEITEEVFYDFIEGIRYFKKACSYKTYLFSIAKYKVIDYIRKKKFKQILFSALPEYVVNGLCTVFMDDEIDKKELAHRIEKAISKLPNDYQLILRLKYIEGATVSHIAETIMRSFKATESMLFRARKAFIHIFAKI